jgi:diguanylate cyclase (GGDEF)-like protein
VAKKRLRPSGAQQGNGRRSDPDLNRLAALDGDQSDAAADQSASDEDQTVSDADQSVSDLDSELTGGEQRASDRDQRASDRDQAVSDKELKQHPGLASKKVHDAGLADRQVGTREREAGTEIRALVAEQRARQAALRDEGAWHRDLTAQARDAAADRRDQESAKLERTLASRGSSLRTALVHAAEVRTQAMKDRQRAAEDRKQAAADRRRAAEEREQTLAELQRAHLDEVTSAFRRGFGDEALQGEVDRARRGDGRLVLAFIDVDGLRAVNNRAGHSAGDALLRDVVSAIRSKIRSYEPIVRYGGDEFLCAVSNVDLDQAEERFDAIKESLAEIGSRSTISVGLAELRPEDTLADLIDRADAALLDARRQGPPEAG